MFTPTRFLPMAAAARARMMALALAACAGAFYSGPAHLGEARAASITSGCGLDERSAPEIAGRISATVLGRASDDEVRAQTAVAIARSHAAISARYADLPRINAAYVFRGARRETIAAVVDGKMPQTGDAIELAARHRDPNSPCAFIPWTVIPGSFGAAPGGGVAEETRHDSETPKSGPSHPGRLEIPLRSAGGGFVAVVMINGVAPVEFMVDSGASTVVIPAAVAAGLARAGTLDLHADLLGQGNYRLADGRTVAEPEFRIQSLKIGDRVLENVRAAVTSTGGTPLLGQSFLKRFRSWSIDNQRQVLILN